MKYSLVISDKAKVDIKSLDTVTQRRIVKKLKFFLDQENPLEYAKKLIDLTEGQYRWRIGPYRAIFDIQDMTIRLLRVQHRSVIYRK